MLIKRKRFSVVQIVGVLKQAEVVVGISVPFHKLWVEEQTISRPEACPDANT